MTAANPFSSALSLIGNLTSLAVLYLLASGDFITAAQGLVYAGAVKVMFSFRDRVPRRAGRSARWAPGARLFQVSSVIAAVSLLA